MTDVYDFLLKLRAIRDFKPDPLAAEDLAAILEAGRWTGSSKNRQDWSFVVIADHDRLQELAGHGDFTEPVRDSAATIVLVQEPGGPWAPRPGVPSRDITAGESRSTRSSISSSTEPLDSRNS